jgi:large subunit ribosomal protein L19
MAIAFTPADTDARKELDFTSGDTVRVWSKIEDKGKFRLQAFEGLVLARKHGTTPSATFTVRKISNSVGVERIYPLYSPMIDKIEITKRAKTRRSKLYYIRDKAAKEIRRKMKTIVTIGKGAKKLEIPETVTEVPEGSEE